MATEKPRFSITLDENLLEKVEDYRHENRISTRSKAVVQLVEQGINELLRTATDTKKVPSTRDETLLNLFHSLNKAGQDRLIEDAEMLAGNEKYSKNSADKLA